MSLGNDIVLCPLCDDRAGGLGCPLCKCPLCKGTGLAFTWDVDAYWKKQRELLKEKDKFVNLEKI